MSNSVLRDSAEVVRAELLRKAFREHWQRVSQSIDLITDFADIGIIAGSLGALCETLGNVQDFDDAVNGEFKSPELEAALGLEPNWAKR